MSQLIPHIRQARSDDHSGIASLLCQLGYEVSPDEVLAKLEVIHANSAGLVLVAADSDAIIGCISLHVLPLFHAAGCLGRITALVVDESNRGLRVGSALMAAADDWFAKNACVKIEVTSGDHRVDAHRFYVSHHFERDGQRFSKTL